MKKRREGNLNQLPALDAIKDFIDKRNARKLVLEELNLKVDTNLMLRPFTPDITDFTDSSPARLSSPSSSLMSSMESSMISP